MRIFQVSKAFPSEEKYSLTDQILGKLVNMILHPDQWTIRSLKDEESDYA